MRRRVAVCDIDGTVFRSSLLIELVEAMVIEGVFPKDARRQYEREYHNWQNRQGSYQKYIIAVVATFMQHIKGVPFSTFVSVGEQVIATQQYRTYRYTRDLIRRLKRDGYFLVAISQSPKAVLEPFCKTLGFDKVYGRLYELGPSDQFTGAVVDEHLIANKANIVRRVVEKEGLTMEGSVGIGDTEGDIPMLELVERPICFNPNHELYRHAKVMQWPVVVERKDVIYELIPSAVTTYTSATAPVL